MNFMKKVRNRIKNKHGMTTIEIAICALIFIVAISGFVDLTQVLNKLNTISQTNSYIARTISKQGGVRTRNIDNFAGEYVTTQELYRNVETSLTRSGIPHNNWELYIDEYKIKPETNTPIRNYGETINIRLDVKYNWTLISNFIPGKITQTKKSYRNVVSTYKIRNESMNSEYKN